MTHAPVASGVDLVEWSAIQEEFTASSSESGGRALLLGNGFSSNIWDAFKYDTLLNQSALTSTARRLFGDRVNFETVLAELATAHGVLSVVVPSETQLLKKVEGLADEVRGQLLYAVGQVHPDAKDLVTDALTIGNTVMTGVPGQVIQKIAGHLPMYSKVFTTNYDVIAYWAAVHASIADLFSGTAPFDEEQADRWMVSNTQPKIFFLHGALHLWRSLTTNAEHKDTAKESTLLLDVVKQSVNSADRVPLFISEGSSSEKVARIGASPYLSFCGRTLAATDEPLTVLGQALVPEVDGHICEAIERHPERRVAVGVWVGDVQPNDRAQKLWTRAKEVAGRIAKCRNVVFFDSTEHPLTSPTLKCLANT